MADEVTTPAAESSPAPEAKPADEIGSMAVPSDPEAYAEWRMTGKLPENGRKPPRKETSATSKKPSVDSDEESESAAVPETVPAGKKRSAEKRIDQLTAEKEAIRREFEEYKAKSGKQDAAKPSESSSVPKQPDPSNEPVAPEQQDFKTWDEFRAAERKYAKDLAQWIADQRIAEYEQKLRQQAAAESMQTRLNEAKSRYGEEAEPKVLNTATTVFEDKGVAPAIKAAIGRSEVIVDALYVMGSDPDELASFVELSKKDPLEALRKWFTVEALVKQELGKSKPEPEASPPVRASDGKFLPAKRSAPAPPTELNGNSSPPGDERDRAANTGNVRAFFAEGNRRDVQRWKGNI